MPDHGKLVPWRFIVFEGEARRAAGDVIVEAFRAKYPDAKPEHAEFERRRLARAPLVIAVVSRAAPHVKIPEWEQVLSAGAAAMNLVLAAQCARLRRVLDHRMVRLRSRVCSMRWVSRRTKSIAGFIHIGRPPGPPEDRPRPPLDEIATRFANG